MWLHSSCQTFHQASWMFLPGENPKNPSCYFWQKCQKVFVCSNILCSIWKAFLCIWECSDKVEEVCGPPKPGDGGGLLAWKHNKSQDGLWPMPKLMKLLLWMKVNSGFVDLFKLFNMFLFTVIFMLMLQINLFPTFHHFCHLQIKRS